MDLTASYIRHFPGLAEAVAASRPTQQHTSLLECLRRVPALEAARLATTRGDTWLHRRMVFTNDGRLVAEDHEAWLAEEVARDGGHVAATCTRLDAAGYRLSKCNITNLYVVVAGHSGDPSDFLQIEVAMEDETMDLELRPGQGWRKPRTLEELQREADQGPPLPDDERALLARPRTYRLRRIVDVDAWLKVADALHDVSREEIRSRRYRVTSSATPGATIQTTDELFPGWDRFPAKHRRYFRDWQRSSAAPYRLCDQWVLNLTDWTDARGHRTLDMIPMWAFNRPLAKVNAAKGSDYEFYGRLQKLDRRTGVPFGWFFYMLHGNRVDGDAAERVIRAAEAGTIVMPECDYRVLKDWQDTPYGF